jgi:hypothetical protein
VFPSCFLNRAFVRVIYAKRPTLMPGNRKYGTRLLGKLFHLGQSDCFYLALVELQTFVCKHMFVRSVVWA